MIGILAVKGALEKSLNFFLFKWLIMSNEPFLFKLNPPKLFAYPNPAWAA